MTAAFDFSAPVKPSAASQAAYEVVRQHVKKLEEDRALHDDINNLARVAQEGKILEAAEAVTGKLK